MQILMYAPRCIEQVDHVHCCTKPVEYDDNICSSRSGGIERKET